MSDTNINLKSKLSEVLETLNYIVILYALFLLFLGMKLHNSELILQTCIMFVVYIIFDYMNYDVVKITNKGIKCTKYGFISWNDMYIVKKKHKTILIYTKARQKPYKFIIKKNEDDVEYERAYKYIISKVKTPEKVKKDKMEDDNEKAY